MTPVFPRTSFHSSKLIRCLTELKLLDAADPENGVAEKLGLWINFSDAIALSTVHSESPLHSLSASQSATWRKQQPAVHAVITAEFERIQMALTSSITQGCTPDRDKSHIKLIAPTHELPFDRKTAYLPYARLYEAQVREMEMMIQPLRVNVRAALVRASPRLRKLAELDAMFEKILRAREKQLLAKVPALLKKRFDQLCDAEQRALSDTPQPPGEIQKSTWLARFCIDMQTLLLAEMDLRLQPTMGLLDAINDDGK